MAKNDELILRGKALEDLRDIKEMLVAAGDPFLAAIMNRAITCIENQPAADAAEVVRCKDCKWRNTKGCPYKNFNAAERGDDDFCSDGEGGGAHGR